MSNVRFAKPGSAAPTPLNPPTAGWVVGLVVFRRGRIVGFAVGPRPATGSAFHPMGWRGEKAAGDDVVPAGNLEPGQLAYCRAFKVDAPDRRGRFLADYFA